MIKTINDRYEGIIIEDKSLPESKHEFKEELLRLIKSIRNKKLLWVRIPIEKSDFIPILTRLDFNFHQCNNKSLMLVKKLEPDCFVPTAKNYILGVGAIVIHKGLLLVVKDRFNPGYKLPGGHVDYNESLKDALKREIFEETGIHTSFESIVNLGHFKNGQFDESGLYVVCTAKALSENIKVNDSDEIIEARWIDPNDFLNAEDVNNYNKSVLKAALNNKELKLTEQQIKLKIKGGEVFF